jgi:hypothetical protein
MWAPVKGLVGHLLSSPRQWMEQVGWTVAGANHKSRQAPSHQGVGESSTANQARRRSGCSGALLHPLFVQGMNQ